MYSASREPFILVDPRAGNVLTSMVSGSFEDVQTSPVYFDREDVKRAIHAPLHVKWSECSEEDVFPHGDRSLPPAFTVLPSAIERSERAVIVHGLADYVLISEGLVPLLHVHTQWH